MFDFNILHIVAGIPGLLIAMVMHEYAHALVADYMGDDTPRLMGRLTLNPMFAPSPTSDTGSVGNSVRSVTVTPTVEAGSTITVNGTAVTSGTVSAPINLNVGINTINIVVNDGVSTLITPYTITVTRAPSDDGTSGGGGGSSTSSYTIHHHRGHQQRFHLRQPDPRQSRRHRDLHGRPGRRL